MKNIAYALLILTTALTLGSCRQEQKTTAKEAPTAPDTIPSPQNTPESVLDFVARQFYRGHSEEAYPYLFCNDYSISIASSPDSTNAINKRFVRLAKTRGGYVATNIRGTRGINDTLYIRSNIEFGNTTLGRVESKLIKVRGEWKLVLLKDNAPLAVNAGQFKVLAR